MNSSTAAKVLLGLGLFHIPLVALHFLFPVLFDWSHDLPLLSPENRGIFLCLDACGIFGLSALGAMSLLDGLRRMRGRAPLCPDGLWAWTGAFYAFRAACEFPCFGFSWSGLVLVVLVLAMSGLYLAVWWTPLDVEVDFGVCARPSQATGPSIPHPTGART